MNASTIAKNKKSAIRYFSGLLEGYENRAEIPAYGTISADEKCEDNQIIRKLDAGLVARFEQVCRSVGATLSDGMDLAWGMVLQTVCRMEDVVFTKAVSGRDNTSADVSNPVGVFSNFIPVRVKTGKNSTTAELLKELHEQSLEGKAFDFCPLTDIQKAIGMTEGLVYSILCFGNYRDDEENLSMPKPMLVKEEHKGDYVVIDAATQSDGSIEVVLSFDPNRYRKPEMERLVALMENYITRMAEQPHCSIHSMPLLSRQQEEKIIALSAGETLEYNTSETWMDMFLRHAKETPEKIAVVDNLGEFTYRELDKASNSIAAWLTEQGVENGNFVALRMGRVKEFLAAVIGVQKAGAAYVPIDPEYPQDRINYMVEDSEAKAVLTEETVAEAIAAYPNPVPVNRAVPEGRAYMIYTSGSTGRPKGVVQSHRSLRALVAWMNAKFDITEDSVHVEHPSFSFGASLMDLICPIAAGGTLHVLSEEMRRDMADMKDYLTAHCVSMATFSTQIGMALVNQYPELPVRYIMMGGEKLLPCRKTDIRLINGYGSTEFTVCSSYHVVNQEKDTDIPIGRPVPNTWSFICDEYGNLLPQGIAGELCLAGCQIAEGYWKQPELTAKSFVECSFLEGQVMYRTGDLARYNEDGELEYLGRIDNQVKLRGFRIELGEIETRAGQYDGIGQVAAEVRKDQLVLYYTHKGGTELDSARIKNFMAETLTEYMVPTVYMPLDVMPMTPNGKIDRRALPEPEISGVGEIVPPETETESRFFEIAAKLLGRSNFGVTDNLVGFGLSSIGAMRFAAEIDRVCNLRIPVADILRTPTIRALGAWADQGISATSEQLKPYSKQEFYPVTENQRGIIIDWERNRGTTQYNIPEVIQFDGVAGNILVEAVKAALNAHVYLKTVFVYGDGDMMQQRRDEDEPVVSLTELNEEPDKAFFQSRILPFDLFTERLYRMEVYTFGSRAWLFADIHHTVYDGLSRDALFGEVRRALAGERLKGETLTAYDIALYEKELRESETYAEAKKYFDALMEGAAVASLPASHKSGETPEKALKLSVPAKEIDTFCKDCDVTAGSFFQAAFGEVLHRITREKKPFYVTVSNGRSASPALIDSVGMFVKTLPVVVVQEAGAMTCKDYVRAMHQELQESYAREFYPYTDLVETHGLRAEMMLVYQGGVGDSEQKTRYNTYMELELDTVKLPISIDIFPDDGAYVLLVEYDGMRYSRTDVELFAEMVKNAALGLAKETYVKEVNLVSEDEAKKLLALSAGEKLIYNREETWVDLFLKHVKKTPEKTAVVDGTGEFSYKELDEASDSIAVWLKEKGVAAGNFVALRMGRVKEFLAAVLGVHKIGAAYLPIDPAYPEDRIAYMLEDSEAQAVLTEETVAEAIAAYPNPTSVNRAVPEGRAYMIYTSGSTGKPKGVVIQHKAMLNFIHFIRARWHLTEKSRIACHSTFSFDASVEDLYPALTVGGSVFIVPEEARRDIFEMRNYLKRNGITGGCYTTRFGQLLGGDEALDVDYIVLGGEAMTSGVQARGTVYNTYGPTEFTVDATYFELEKGKEYDPIPIGRPVYNAWAFICDTRGHLLPKGVAGELCLAGTQLAEGYWKRPKLTAKSFVACPSLPGQKMYRTGDLARYNEAGELEYLGRIDYQVKFRGFRIELGEIENRAGQYAGMEQVAAEVRKDQLVLYYTQTEGSRIQTEQLKSFLAETLADYMVPTIYMLLDFMPMTPSGKLNRKALPEPEIKRTEYVAPANETECAMAEVFGKILGIKEKIGAMDDFLVLGGDSIKAIRVVSLLRERGIHVSVPDILSKKTVRGIASCVEQTGTIVIRQEPYEGEVADTAIVAFFKDLKLPEPWHYNQCQLLSMKERAVFPALQKALDALTLQHDLLRAIWLEEHLYVRGANQTLTIEEYKASTEEKVTEICNEIQSHIKMDEALVRVALIHCKETDLFFIAAHHLVVDGVSWRILTSDLEMAYASALSGEVPRLPDKTHTYRDYAETLQRYRNSYALRREIPYWEAVEKKMKALPLSKAKDYSRGFEELTVIMDKEDTAKFLRGAFEKFHGDINDALLTAVGRCYAGIQGVSAVSFQMEGHGRENLGETLLTDRTVGWFTSIYPVVVEDLTGDILHDLLRTKEALHRVPNKGVGYNILRFIEGLKKTTFSSEFVAQIEFNYLGDMSVGEEKGETYFSGSSIDTGDDLSRKNVEGADLSINCMVTDGCFELSLRYAGNVYGKETARHIAEGILKEMSSIASFLEGYDGARLTATDLGETEWSEAEFEAVMAEFAERGERIERIYPLLPMQEGMLLKHVSEPESWGYRLVDIYEMDWVPEENQLRRALDRLGEKHEVLRTAIIHENVSVPRQAIVDRHLGLSMVDLSVEAEPEAAVKALREDILTNGFDLQKKPLFSLTCAKKNGESSYLILAVHHSIVDGWCGQLYMNDLVRYMKEEQQGRITEDTEQIHDGVYESAVREILKKDMDQGLQYWRKLLEGYETPAEIPFYGEVPEEERATEDGLSINLSEDTTEKLVSLCRKAGATPGNAVELLWGMVLSAYGRTEDVVFAKVVSGRDNTEVDANNLVGLFINSVPVRLKLEKTTTAAEALSALQEQSAESSRYDYCPLASIQQQTDLGSALFQTVLAFENYNSGKESEVEESESLLKQLVLREEHFDEITPSAYMDGGKLYFHISFNPLHYRESEIGRILSLIKTFAEGIAEQPERPLSALERLNPEEMKKMVELSKGEALLYDHGETWVDLFLKHAKETPEKTAVVDSTGEFTYKELDAASDSIAAWLMEHGVTSGGFVALRMGRVKEFLAAVIGVHKAGAAYVPIDPAYPEERIAYMLENSEAQAVLIEETVKEALEEYPHAKRVNRAVPEGRAYMIYTSGSTGKPKGVVQSHRSLRALAAWRMAKLHITEENVHAVHASFSFDTSLNDLITSNAAGGTLHIIPEEMRRDLAGMRDYFVENHVDVITLSTQIGMAMLNQYPDMPLRCLMMGGEKMLPCKKTDIRLINEYGPTEFTVCSSYHVVDQEKDTDIPIGRPVPNTYSFICDAYGHVLPQGMVGELCLAGNQIAEGYWKQPELTAKSFVECPFLKGQRMYRTGDLARYNEAGELEYLGRIDNMVKLRGFRIEMGEIENRAGQYAGIEQVAAAVKKDQLVLYYTKTDGVAIDPEQLKKFLAESLTEYMVPTVYMLLAVMPMTPNGKIDRKALPEPDVSAHKAEYEAPEGELERKLCEAFENVLGLGAGTIGRNDDFFLLGGSSIKAMMVMLNCGIEGLGTKTIFKYKTARLIAEAMADKAAEDLESYEQVARSKSVPATFGQISMLDYQFLNPRSVMHNIPLCYCFDASFDAERLSAAVNQAIRQHPALSTIFDVDENGNIVQRIEPDILEKTVVEDISAEEWKKLTGSLVSPFEMFRAPLFRARLFRCGEELYLFMDMHHTISDGMSLKILLEDINKAYRHEKLERDYYYSYIRKEYENRETKEYKDAKQYFSNLLSGRNWCSIPTTDYESWEVEPGEEEYPNLISITEIKRGEERLGVSRNVIAIAAAMLAMREYCQRDEIRVDYLNNNRTDAYLQHTVGLIFKILPLAVDIGKYTSMKALLQEISRQVVDGLAHSICDYGSLDNVALDDAMEINYLPDDGDDSGMSGIKPMELNEENTYNATESHVAIYLTEENGQVHLRIEYQRKAYAEGSMKRFLDMYVKQFRQLLTYIC